MTGSSGAGEGDPNPGGDPRAVFAEHLERQSFEHQLIDRKTTWLLTTQGLLFAAYGVTFEAGAEDPEKFRSLLAVAGLSIAAIVLAGVIGLILSKWRLYKAYRLHFDRRGGRDLPAPWTGQGLKWGVGTSNTLLTLAPDVLLPVMFIATWGVLLG